MINVNELLDLGFERTFINGVFKKRYNIAHISIVLNKYGQIDLKECGVQINYFNYINTEEQLSELIFVFDYYKELLKEFGVRYEQDFKNVI